MNTMILSSLTRCVPFTPRTYANNNATDTAAPFTQQTVSSIDVVNGQIILNFAAAHFLLAGDSLVISGSVDAVNLDGRRPVVSVPSTTSVNCGPTAAADATGLDPATIVADIFGRKVALIAGTVAGAANADDVNVGHTATLQPYTLTPAAPTNELTLLAPEGAKLNLADLYLKPASAGANGMIAILY